MKVQKRLLKGSMVLASALLFSHAFAESVELTNRPLFISSTADPNLMFILDDSGSMQWGYMPDDIFGVCNRNTSVNNSARGRSSDYNPMYYDPEKTYEPPMSADGTQLPDADFNEAWFNGYAQNGDVDLSSEFRAIWDPRFNYNGTFCGQAGPADYFEYDASCGDPEDNSCYDRTIVGPNSGPNGEDERQNFANWYSYYHRRIFAARAGITQAFIDQPESMRIGYGSLNEGGTIRRGVLPFEGEDREDFFDWLQTRNAAGGTPLRQALIDAGEYYEGEEDTGPWADDPGVSDGQDVDEFAECRQSFSILMTDGYYGNSDPEPGNVDGNSGPNITGPGDQSFQYSPTDPFQDSYEDTLADIAMQFWYQDLQPDIVNRVPDSDRNPAFWQHMVTYGVGLGVQGTIDPDQAIAAMLNGNDISWPNPFTNNDHKIDDLLHAGVNSRGGFFSATDPQKFATELSGVLGDIAEATGSSTGVTFDTATLEEDSLIFGARFNSGRWSGDLDARELISDEESDEPPEISDPVWSAATELDNRDWTTREIITSDGEQGIPFTWDTDALTAEQIADLQFGGGSAAEKEQRAINRLDYLRGDRSLEGTDTGEFRTRDSRLGDIVNSTPVRVSEPASPWPDSDEFGEDGNRYSDFRADQSDRTPVIYAGANDGMLHAFKATEDGGNEMFAFMPSAIFSDEPGNGLHHLTQQEYAHNYYVDLRPLVSDAFIKSRDSDGSMTNSADWRTVLIGGARFGGKSIFALDVTDPSSFDEDNAAELMLWEFTAEDAVDADGEHHMGFIKEPPTIAKAKWGNNDKRWTAFFGNGYNAEDPATGIFMVDLEGGLDGTWTQGDDYRFIEFEAGTGATGMSPINLYDSTGNGIVDRIYGGDRNGQLWVAKAGNQGFETAYKQGNTPEPLFTAETDGGDPQSITAAPLVIPNKNQAPSGGDPDLFVLFGTGQYLNSDDLSDTSTDSFYAVRDKGSGGVARTDLDERELVESTTAPEDMEVLLSEEVGNGDVENGWYVDLFAEGERITLSPQVRGEFIFVNSSIPSDNPCVAGGSSRIMAFGLDGLTPERAVFDEYDGEVTSYRKVDGIASQSAFLGDYRFTPTSLGEVDVEGVDIPDLDDALGRQGWQELLE